MIMIKHGDFIELDYTGKIKDDKVVFDTTSEQVAKDNQMFNAKYKYGPVIVCMGEGHLVKGLDDSLIGKNPGKYTIEVKAEHAFGKKSAELLKLIPMKLFSKDQVKPFVGLEVNVDGTLGIVRSVSGGRVIVDFNHPLSSKDLVYDVEVKRIVVDPLEKTRAVLELMAVPFDNIDIVDEKGEITLKTGLPPKEIIDGLSESIKHLAGLKAVEFKTKQEVKKELKEEVKKEKQEKKAEDKAE
jgi:FKBP-type peptidyl-prolyl cis-trans isomerase 2